MQTFDAIYESYGCHDDGDASAESFEHMLASLNDCWLLVHRRDCLAFEDQLAKVLQSRISRGVGRPTDTGEGTLRGSEQMDKFLQLLPRDTREQPVLGCTEEAVQTLENARTIVW